MRQKVLEAMEGYGTPLPVHNWLVFLWTSWCAESLPPLLPGRAPDILSNMDSDARTSPGPRWLRLLRSRVQSCRLGILCFIRMQKDAYPNLKNHLPRSLSWLVLGISLTGPQGARLKRCFWVCLWRCLQMTLAGESVDWAEPMSSPFPPTVGIIQAIEGWRRQKEKGRGNSLFCPGLTAPGLWLTPSAPLALRPSDWTMPPALLGLWLPDGRQWGISASTITWANPNRPSHHGKHAVMQMLCYGLRKG